MKDIPVFTTEYGIASLALREIPYRGCAYITLYETDSPALLLSECVDFCRACGAEQIFATGHCALQEHPIAATIIQMQLTGNAAPQTDAKLLPVTKETVAKWRELFNSRMEGIALSAFFTPQDDAQLLADGDAYFVEKDSVVIGIGKASRGTVHAVASLVPGMGETVMRALFSTLAAKCIRLTVAEHNEKAIALYKRLGFKTSGSVTKWYQVK